MTFSKEFFFISFILFIVEFVRGAYLITFLPNYAVEKLGFSVAIVGIAVSAHYLTDTVMKTGIGYLLDRFSTKVVVQVGLFLSLVGLFIMQYVQNSVILIITAAIFGIGASPVWLVSMSLVQEGNRAQQMGYLYTGWLIGLGAGPVLINFFIDVSYRVAFFFMVMLWIIGFLLSFFIKRGERTSITIIPLQEQLRELINRLKQMGIFIPGMILQTMSAGMLVPILPSFASKYLGLSHSQYSYVLIAGGASAVLGLVPMGKLSDRYEKKWFLVVGFGLLSIGIYMLPLWTSLRMVIFVAIVMGLSYSAVLPAWNALLSYYVPEQQQGLGWGILSSVEGIGVILGPIIGGWLGNFVGQTFTIVMSATLLLGVAIFYLILPAIRLQKHS